MLNIWSLADYEKFNANDPKQFETSKKKVLLVKLNFKFNKVGIEIEIKRQNSS